MRRKPDKLSRRQSRWSAIKQRIVALFAIATLAALVGGVPYLLVTVVGSPLPAELPTWPEIQAALQGQIRWGPVIDVLTALAWLAWAQFTLCVLVELRAGLSRARTPARRIPLAGFNQSWARRLVIAALLLVTSSGLTPAVAGTHPAARPATTVSAPLNPTAVLAGSQGAALGAAGVAADPSTARAAGPFRQYIVHEGDNLWDIAERYLAGDGLRYQEIWELNRDQVQPDGAWLTNPDVIKPGWVLRMPAEASDLPQFSTDPTAGLAVYTVREGDTLGKIADRELGDPEQYGVIFRLNQDRVQPDGRTLSDPDLIYPGWELVLPIPATSPGTGDGTPDRPPADSPTAEPAAPAGSPVPVTEPEPAQPAAPPAQPPHVTPPAATPEVSNAPPPTQSPVPATEQRDTPAEVADEEGVQLLNMLGYGALLSAGVLGLLGFKRMLQQRRRRPGGQIKLPPPPIGDLELAMRASEDPIGAELVDRALRTLSANLAKVGGLLPNLDAVRLSRYGVELFVADPEPPTTPFEPGSDDLSVWLCPPDHPGLLDERSAAQIPAPYPALVTLGTDPDGGHILIDLESAGAVSLVGQLDDAETVLRAMAVELATSRWADDLAVSLVGVGADLPAAINGDRLSYSDSLDDEVHALERWSGDVAGVLEGAATFSTRDSRTQGVAADTWTPRVILSAEPVTAEAAQRFTGLLTAVPRASIAAVVSNPTEADLPGPWMLDCTTRTPIALPVTGLRVRLQRLEDGDYVNLVAMLATANDSEPTPPSGWGEQVPVEPDLGAHPPAPPPSLSVAPPPQPEGASPWAGSVVLDLAPAAPPIETEVNGFEHDYLAPVDRPDSGFGQTSGGAPTQLLTEAPPAPASTELPTQLPTLAPEPWSQTPAQGAPAVPAVQPAPQICVLGPVLVKNAVGDVGERRASLTELAAFLALHPGSAHHSVTEALWPGRRTDAQTRNSQMSRLRRWFGRDPDGTFYLPMVNESDGYNFAATVTCDWRRFKSLARRGMAAGPDGVGQLQGALELVRGQPFAGVSPRRYAWAEHLKQDMISAIVDVAHALSVRLLEARDPYSARRAATKGLLAAPEAELLWRDLLRAEYGAHNPGGIQHALDRLSALNDELGVEMEPETIALIEELERAARRVQAS
ncbi:MAG: LysM peptidoglycan-binding domain-containing protein [Sporichthyaceae bacterium]|nr:LysM peptidoglycan-binding domain-containing protein [Sporichthyaceae bacterium]